MLKKQIRTLGHNAIVKNNQSHQEAFDEISQNNKVDHQLLADELSKIPSSGKQKRTASLRYIFIASLVLLGVLRILGVIVIITEMQSDINMGLISLLVVFGLFVPGLGIYAAVFAKAELYMTTGILLGVSLFRSISRGELSGDPEALIALVPFAVAVILAFYIPFKLKTPNRRIVHESFVDGKLVKKVEYEFEDTRSNESDLLDSSL